MTKEQLREIYRVKAKLFLADFESFVMDSIDEGHTDYYSSIEEFIEASLVVYSDIIQHEEDEQGEVG